MNQLDLFESWLYNKNLKKRTVEQYIYYFIKFQPFGFFNQESVSRFLSKKSNRNEVARSFLINFQKFMMVNYKSLGLDKDARIDISEVELPKLSGRREEKLIKPLTEEQILHLEKFLTNEKEKLQLLMSFYGGLRIGELMKIRISSFNWEVWKKDMEKLGECKVFGKGSREGLAFFPNFLMKRIATYIRNSSFISPGSYLFLRNKKDLGDVNIVSRLKGWERKLRNAGVKSGITQLDANKKIIEETKVNPHRLRHSWGYHLKTVKKIDLRDIQEILRHKSIQSTIRYTYVDKTHLKEVLK